MTALPWAWAGPLSQDFFRQAFAAGTAAAVAAGLVGSFLVLRNQIFAGDALSHVAFTGGLAALAFGFAARTGVFTATVAVSDNDGGTGTGSARVTVWTPQQGIQALAQQVGTLGLATPPLHPLTNAVEALNRGDRTAALNEMNAFLNQVQALVGGRRITIAQGDELSAFANRIIRSING